MGCMCFECKHTDMVVDNHGDFVFVCVCREAEGFLKEIEPFFGNCDYGEISDIGAEEGGES